MARRSRIAGSRVGDAKLGVVTKASLSTEMTGGVVSLAVGSAHGAEDLLAAGRARAGSFSESVHVAVERTFEGTAGIQPLGAGSRVDEADGATGPAGLYPEQTLVGVGTTVRTADGTKVPWAGSVATTDGVPLFIQLTYLRGGALDTLARITGTRKTGLDVAHGVAGSPAKLAAVGVVPAVGATDGSRTPGVSVRDALVGADAVGAPTVQSRPALGTPLAALLQARVDHICGEFVAGSAQARQTHADQQRGPRRDPAAYDGEDTHVDDQEFTAPARGFPTEDPLPA